MTIEKAIQKHGAMKVFEAAAAGECENFEPLKALGLDVSTIDDVEKISWAAQDRMTAEEKAALHWEASRGLHKDRAPIQWDEVEDFSAGPRLSDESESDYLHREMLGELIQQQTEKRRCSE